MATMAVLVLLAVPLVVALISVSRETWYPTGDMAQAELHVAGFFSHPPLVGAAGRIGDAFAPYGQGSHPGPAMWFALLPAYLVTGRSSFGMELGMTLMQLTFIVLTVVVVRRLIGAAGGLLTAVVATVLVHAMGPAVFIEPWNPWGGVFAFFAFIALCWGISCGRHRWLPAAAFCGFFAVQCHTGYALLVGSALAAMVVCLALQWQRTRRGNDDVDTIAALGDCDVVVDGGRRHRVDVATRRDRPDAPRTRQPAHSVAAFHAQHGARWFPACVCGARRRDQGLRR